MQKVINELIQKKSNGIDSTQSDGYYKDNVVGGFEAREEAALWDIAKQGADVLGSHDYGTVPDATAPRQARRRFLRKPMSVVCMQVLHGNYEEKM